MLYFTITNDITFDQRMIRICTSLSNAGYEVTLIGRKLPNSLALSGLPFKTKRLHCFFKKGKLFYAEFSIRLFCYLLTKNVKGICAIDLDTILPCYYISKIKKVPRIYDAHELFCEMKEVSSRPSIYKIWKIIEKKTVPHFKAGYTVNETIANLFEKMYGVKYEVIRNVSRYEPHTKIHPEEYILCQGAVNEGRAFETLIPAMKQVAMPLWIVGDGNFMNRVLQIVQHHHLEDKVKIKGAVTPAQLKQITRKAYAGITLFDREGVSNYYSLANRFFDYIHAGIPQLCVNYPEYARLNKTYDIAVLIEDVAPDTIAEGLNKLIKDNDLWNRLQKHTIKAAEELNWQNEELKLVAFYRNIFG